MAIVSLAQLKSYFNRLDKPKEQQYVDLIDTLGQQNNLRTVEYTIGVPGVTGVDHNFTSVANTTEQSIQLGGTTIIPANSPIIQIVVKCIDGLSGVITGTCDIGVTSGASGIGGPLDLDDTNEIISTGGLNLPSTSISATSIYFSFTPSANWDTITTGKWKVWISYIDNSLL